MGKRAAYLLAWICEACAFINGPSADGCSRCCPTCKGEGVVDTGEDDGSGFAVMVGCPDCNGGKR